MNVSFSVTYRRHLVSCNDLIIDKIIVYNYGVINEKKTKRKLIFIYIVGHLRFLINVNYILINFS